MEILIAAAGLRLHVERRVKRVREVYGGQYVVAGWFGRPPIPMPSHSERWLPRSPQFWQANTNFTGFLRTAASSAPSGTTQVRRRYIVCRWGGDQLRASQINTRREIQLKVGLHFPTCFSLKNTAMHLGVQRDAMLQWSLRARTDVLQSTEPLCVCRPVSRQAK